MVSSDSTHPEQSWPRAYLPYSIVFACLVAVGTVSHTYMRTDGPLGVVVGLAIVAYTIVSTKRESENVSAIQRFIGAYAAVFAIVGILVSIMGLLDTIGLL